MTKRTTTLPPGFARIGNPAAQGRLDLNPAPQTTSSPAPADDFDTYGEPSPAPTLPASSTPATPRTTDDPAGMLADAIRSIAAGASSRDEEAARRLVELAGRVDELAGRLAQIEQTAPTVLSVKLGDVTTGTVKNPRPELPELIRTVAAGLTNIWLTGPAGSGKTTLAEELAEALGRPFAAQSFAPDMTTAALVGGLNSEGKFQESEFVRAFESGAVYLFDEVDAAPADIIVVVNAALANGKLFLPRHHDPARRIIHRHPNTVVVCAANTWGTGADATYIGRAPLDGAFLDRFALSMFAIGYDPELERRLCPDDELRGTIQRIRAECERLTVRRIVGTRAVRNAAMLRAAGYSIPAILERLFAGWTKEQRAKVGHPAP